MLAGIEAIHREEGVEPHQSLEARSIGVIEMTAANFTQLDKRMANPFMLLSPYGQDSPRALLKLAIRRRWHQNDYMLFCI